MNVVEEAGHLLRLARWGLAMARHDTRYPSPVPDNPKFMTARQAVALIRDGAVVAASGLGAHQRASILYWAIREAFAETGHPRRLTVMNIGGHGSRGLLPGSIDELAQSGLCTRLISSHFETMRAMQELAAAGRCEVQCIPLGIMALLFAALGRGQDSLLSDTGVDTFIDPRVGRGSPVTGRTHAQLVTVEGNRLRYRIPKIDVALFNLPAADRRGNLYSTNAAIIGDSFEIARAAKRHGGTVIANVGRLVDEGSDRIFVPATMVDAIVCYPDTEQTAGFFHSGPWMALTIGRTQGMKDALDHARLVRWLGALGGGLSRRTPATEALQRLATAVLADQVTPGASVALGAGLPEDIGLIFFEHDRLNDVTFLVESGVIGGVPAPGAYFGAAFSPREIVSTAQLFTRCSSRLDAACLGALEVDGMGNVNVSKRGRGVRNYAGPGGFIDFTEAAQVIIFVSEWMRHGDIVVDGDRMHVRTRGTPKFVERVAEVTFSGPRALRAGKQVHYVTPVGVFQLTARGLELKNVMPGIDVRRDILATTRAQVVVPVSGNVPVVSAAIVTGEGFELPRLVAPVRRRRAAPRTRN